MYTLCLTRAYYDVTSGNNFDCENVHEDIFEQQDVLLFFLRRIHRL